MNGVPYYTMPFVEGASLRARLTSDGSLPITEAIGVLRDVAKALAYAHERGIVHRDIKPDNVLLTGGSAVVTDFGIAKALSAARTDAPGGTLTQIGTSIGTPAYMSPEQAAADPATDHRTDIYSFGCLAYEILAGRPPFTAKSPQKLLAAQMSETPQPIEALRPDVPPSLAQLVMKCLAKEADQRPQSALEIARQLETVTSSSGHVAMPMIMTSGRGMFTRALLAYAVAFAIVAIVAKAAIVAIGLPSWVFPGALVIMALGLPVILFTAYVHRTTRKVFATTPTYTPGGTPSLGQGTMQQLAIKASPHVSWRRAWIGGAAAVAGFVLLVGIYMVLRAMGIGPAGSLLAAGRARAEREDPRHRPAEPRQRLDARSRRDGRVPHGARPVAERDGRAAGDDPRRAPSHGEAGRLEGGLRPRARDRDARGDQGGDRRQPGRRRGTLRDRAATRVGTDG